jgi:hypothetical protein
MAALWSTSIDPLVGDQRVVVGLALVSLRVAPQGPKYRSITAVPMRFKELAFLSAYRADQCRLA